MGSVCCKRLEHPSSPRLPLGKFISRITDALCPQEYGREAEGPRTRKLNSLDISGPLPLTSLDGWRDTALMGVEETPQPPPRRKRKTKRVEGKGRRSNSLAVLQDEPQGRRRTRSLEEMGPEEVFTGLFRYDSNDHLEALDFQLYSLPRLPRRSSSLSEIMIPIHKALPLSKSTGSLTSDGPPPAPFILDPPPPPKKKVTTKTEFLNSILKEGEPSQAPVSLLEPIRENPKEVNNNRLPSDQSQETDKVVPSMRTTKEDRPQEQEKVKEPAAQPDKVLSSVPEKLAEASTPPSDPPVEKKEAEPQREPPKERAVKEYHPVMFSEAEIISTLEKIRSNRSAGRHLESSYHLVYSSPKPYEAPKQAAVVTGSDHSRNPSMTDSLKEFETSIYDMLQESHDASDEEEVAPIKADLKVQIVA